MCITEEHRDFRQNAHPPSRQRRARYCTAWSFKPRANIWSWALTGTWRQDRQTDRPSIVMWLLALTLLRFCKGNSLLVYIKLPRLARRCKLCWMWREMKSAHVRGSPGLPCPVRPLLKLPPYCTTPGSLRVCLFKFTGFFFSVNRN